MKTLNLLIVPLALSLLAHGQTRASGPVYTVTLSAPGLSIEMVDAKVNGEFRFGPGPGNSRGGQPSWNAKSWIVEDWTHPVAEPEKSLRRVQATFTIDRSDRGPRPYVVFFVYEPTTKQGFVYLPGRGEPFYDGNVNLLYRGDEYEGRWFRATAEWTKEAQATIEKAGR